eukprot:3563713-Pyramimonas_sp.AAC.1
MLVDPLRYQIPEDWNYKGARGLFAQPEVTQAEAIPDFKVYIPPPVRGTERSEAVAYQWTSPDEEGLIKFLVEEKSFNEDRVRTVRDPPGLKFTRPIRTPTRRCGHSADEWQEYSADVTIWTGWIVSPVPYANRLARCYTCYTIIYYILNDVLNVVLYVAYYAIIYHTTYSYWPTLVMLPTLGLSLMQQIKAIVASKQKSSQGRCVPAGVPARRRRFDALEC